MSTLALIRVGTLANKSFHLPKGVDKAALAAWRNALRKTMDDPAFLKKKAKILGKFTVTIGEPARKALHAAINLSAEERAYIKKYVKTRYNLDLNM
jgi:tripartite-type tricarboxylate transporter receptor subunit TctC